MAGHPPEGRGLPVSGLLTSQEVAAQLRLQPVAVTDMTRRLILRGIKVGRVWRYRQEDVDIFLESQANRAPERRRRKRAA